MSNRSSDSFPRCKPTNSIFASSDLGHRAGQYFASEKNKWYLDFRNTEYTDDFEFNLEWRDTKIQNMRGNQGACFEVWFVQVVGVNFELNGN